MSTEARPDAPDGVDAPGAPEALAAAGPPGQRPTTRRLLRRLATIVIVATVAVFVVLAVVSQVGALPDIDWRFDPAWLALAAVALIALQGMHAELWRRIVIALHGDLHFVRGFEIWNLSLLARYVPTQLLMVVTRASMAEREGIPKRVTVASIVYEFAFVVAASVAVGAFGMMQLPALRDSPWRWAILLVPVVAIVCLHPKIFGRLAHVLLRRLGADQLPETLGFPTVLALAALYIVSFLIAGLGVWGLAESFYGVGAGDVPLVLTGWAVGYVGALLAFFVPGGLGVREGLLAAVLSIAVPTAVAIAVAVAVRLAQTAVELLYAGVSSLAARRSGWDPDADKNASASASDSGVPIS